jgi:predicted amidohydrolase
MQDLKIALVQANQIWENKTANISNYTNLLQNVSDIDLILLPEMFHTGFSMRVDSLAETMDNSLGLDWLKSVAKNKNAAIYTSLIIKENGNYFNRGVFIEPDGNTHKYDKRKLFGLAGESDFFKAGETETIVEYKNWKFQLQICYDLRFPEIVRNRISSNQSANYDVILYVANWPEKRIAHWKILLAARAIENQCFVIGVNRVGIDGKGLTYSGESMFIDPVGNETILSNEKEMIQIVTLNKSNLSEIQKALPFLKDR